MRRPPHPFILAAVFGVFGAASQAVAEELVVKNDSETAIHHLYVSPSNKRKWGDDQFGDDQVDPGGSFTLRKIPTGTYDLKLVDEDGTECVIEQVLIDESKVWTVTEKILDTCADFGD